VHLTEELRVILDINEVGKNQRRPACGRCGGTGYVYLWSVARAGPRTWFCDRCKRTWSDAEPILATLVGNGAGAHGAPPVLVVDAELQPAMSVGSAVAPGHSPRRLRVVEPTVKAARAAGLDVEALDATDLVVEEPSGSGRSREAHHPDLRVVGAVSTPSPQFGRTSFALAEEREGAFEVRLGA
jgi:hypothetical protein